jgi:hypothetical protein
VSFYATGLSRKDAVFDDELVTLGRTLVRAGDRASLAEEPIDPALAAVLREVGPLYQAAWWPRHDAANRALERRLEPLVDAHGPRVVQFLTRAYGETWPADGYPVNLTAYANWAGAFSTRVRVLLVSSLDPVLGGENAALAFETIFHEAMHQWDTPAADRLQALASREKLTVPPALSHAMIFFTAGEAVRAVIPGHVPYAEAEGVWSRTPAGIKAALEAVWKPYLDGQGSRDAAIVALLNRLKSREAPTRVTIAESPSAAPTINGGRIGSRYRKSKSTF